MRYSRHVYFSFLLEYTFIKLPDMPRKATKNPHENLDFSCGNLTMRNKGALSRTSFIMTMNGIKCTGTAGASTPPESDLMKSAFPP
jgi:hypothetical protein